MPREYRNPPIEDAVCEFRFAPGADAWNVTFFGRLWDKLRADYPQPPQTLSVADIEVSIGEDLQSLQRRDQSPRLRLVGSESNKLVTISKETLAVNCLRPYEGWTQFKQRIEKAFDVYWTEVRPAGISRVGIRYINKIKLPLAGAHEINLEKYFNYNVNHPPELPQTLTGFVARGEYAYPDGARLTVTHAPLATQGGSNDFLLDLDVYQIFDNPLPRENAMLLVERLRAYERDAFESCITDDAREVFDAA